MESGLIQALCVSRCSGAREGIEEGLLTHDVELRSQKAKEKKKESVLLSLFQNTSGLLSLP